MTAPRQDSEVQRADRSRADAPVQSSAQEVNKIAEAKFLSVFEGIFVEDPVSHPFAGSFGRQQMLAFWVWLTRDLMPDLPKAFAIETTPPQTPEQLVDRHSARIVAAINGALAEAQNSQDARRRMSVQLGGDQVAERLPHIAAAIKARVLFDKAYSFGRTANALTDENSLAEALLALPLKEVPLSNFLFHIVVGETSNPSRLVSSVVGHGGGTTEASIRAAGFEALVEALLAHAQSRVATVTRHFVVGGEIEELCAALMRYHRLMRAITGYVELSRGSRWSTITSELARLVSSRVESRLSDVTSQVVMALRRSRDRADFVDDDSIRVALDGIGLLCAVRDARDSMALNATFDKVWSETGQNIEALLMRNLELFRENPSDTNTMKRVDAGLRMAEMRFGSVYVDGMRKARDATARRMGATG